MGYLSRAQVELLSTFSTECELFQNAAWNYAQRPTDFQARICKVRRGHMMRVRSDCAVAGIDTEQLEVIYLEAETTVKRERA